MRVLYMLVPKSSGVWGNVVPLTHVPAHLSSRAGVEPMARPIVQPGERMLDGPDDVNRLRMVLALLDTVGSFFKEVRKCLLLQIHIQIHILYTLYFCHRLYQIFEVFGSPVPPCAAA